MNLSLKVGDALCRWHRLGISVKGNSATALLDCEQQDTKEISRNKAQLRTDGIILYGQEIDDEAFFDVSILFIKWLQLI
jgi:collagen type V/XI/XXIV/XXVII alpha